MKSNAKKQTAEADAKTQTRAQTKTQNQVGESAKGAKTANQATGSYTGNGNQALSQKDENKSNASQTNDKADDRKRLQH